MRFLLLAVLCVWPLAAQGKAPSAYDKPTLEAYVRHLLAITPDVQLKVDDPKPAAIPGMKQIDVHMSLGDRSQDETFYASADGKHIVRGYVYDVDKNPFQADLDKLKTDLSPSFGTAGAPVVMVIFSDFQCPVCKEEAKSVRDNVVAKFPTQVRVYFKDSPLEAIHPWAKPAAIAGRCVFRQSPTGFWKYHDWIYEHQAEITPENLKDKVLSWAKTADVDSLQLGRCMDTKATAAEVEKSQAEAKALHIDSTPTTFINGRRLIGNYPWPNLEQIISGELKYQQNAHNAGEKCCEVSLPSPLKK
ncbi:MAG: DsbA family protein [Acidobacteriota bacterium]|nr:DsbA family protein [Acidobacteriota bacterium]